MHGEKHCDKRHPATCYNFDTYGRCKLGKYCMYMHLESTESKLKRDADHPNSEIAALKNKNKELLYKLSILEKNTSDKENIEIIDTKQDNVRSQANSSNTNIYKGKHFFLSSGNGLKIHIAESHDTMSIIEVPFKCDQSYIKAVSEHNFKVQKAK